MIYGYARISTKLQGSYGNSLESQEQKLRESGATIIYKDSFTGTKTDRPQFNVLLQGLKQGDTLIVTKLDRIARSLTQGSKLINKLIEKGVRVNILNIGMMDNTSSSKLIRNIFFSFAEFERDMIIERTQEGKAIAKTKDGFKEGRPKKYTQAQINIALDLIEKKEKSYTEVERDMRISKSTLIRAMRERKAKNVIG